MLDKIDTPSDLKKLDESQLPQVCDELRRFIIDELSHNPGHLASSLGVVELTVALHYVYDVPEDKIVWDVGHQAYGHKILTGRRTRFSTNRQFGGISGFPNPHESEYDSFVAGHASNSISAALGISIADDKLGKDQAHTVAVIGDAAMSGGLAFEGLNNASAYPNNLLVVLNDNHMAIDAPVGGMSEYLVRLTTSATYNKWRYKLYRFFAKLGWVKEDEKAKHIRFHNSVKAAIANEHNLFEVLNLRYFGPVDGHDVVSLVKILRSRITRGRRCCISRQKKARASSLRRKPPRSGMRRASSTRRRASGSWLLSRRIRRPCSRTCSDIPWSNWRA